MPPHFATAALADAPATRPAWLFLAATFGVSWSLQLPAVLAQRGLMPDPVEAYLPLAGIGAFGPLFAALLAARSAGGGGARAVFRPLREVRIHPGWALVALVLPGALLVAGMAAYALFARRDGGAWLYPPTNAQQVLALLLIPLGEELGWRGFALPRLQARFGALRASLVLGVVWALWHFPVFMLAGITSNTLPWMLPFFTAASVVFTWLYNRGGLWLAVLAHAGAHLNNSHQALPGSATPMLVHTAGYCLLALAILLFDRKAFDAQRRAPSA